MQNNITPELFWLTCMVILTAFMVTPYAIYRLGKLGGLWQVFLRPLPGDAPFEDDWAHRTYRAHMNAFESIALFAPVALIVHISGTGTEATAMASAIYFWSRLVYVPLYYFNVPILRTAIWFVALIATLYLAFHVLFLTLAIGS